MDKNNPVNLEIPEREWQEWLRKLAAFQESTGQYHVPPDWPGDPLLAAWVNQCRNYFHLLPLERIKELNQAGFDFGSDRVWVTRFCELDEYRKQHGHCNVPKTWPKNRSLGRWLDYQREIKDEMPTHRRQLLDGLGVDWSPFETAWNANYAELSTFKEAHGHCNVSSYDHSTKPLGTWVSRQREKRDQLTERQKLLLDKLGFEWEPEEARWQTLYRELQAFKQRFGHCNVPARWPENKPLGSWLSGQRLRRDRLLPQHRKLLDDLGMDWSPYDTSFKKRYFELRAFKETHGHCNVPKEWTENPTLGCWVQNCRNRANRLTERERSVLDKLGFNWNPYEKIWEKHYHDLLAFRDEHGHCDVPAHCAEYPALGAWIYDLRRKADIPAQWKQRLDALGFSWEMPREQAWEQRYIELKNFKERYGHCRVPVAWPKNPVLGRWVSVQRYERSRVSAERQQRLDELGFDWSIMKMTPPKPWDEWYQELVAFKEKFGHCKIPINWPENPKLRRWAQSQRARKNAGELTPQQRYRLEKLGFAWRLRRKNRKRLTD